MFGRLHRAIGCRNSAVRSDQDRDTGGIFRRRIDRSTIGDRRGLVGIAEQVIGEIELVPKRLVGVGGIETDPQNDTVRIVEFLDSITEPFAFDRSPRCVGFWIPP